MALKKMFLTMMVTTSIMVMMTPMLNAQSTPKSQPSYNPYVNQGTYKSESPKTMGQVGQQGTSKPGSEGPRTSESNYNQPGIYKPEGLWLAGTPGMYKTEGPRMSGSDLNQSGFYKPAIEGSKTAGPSVQGGTDKPDANLPTFKPKRQPESSRPAVNAQTNKPAYSDDNRPHFYPDTRKPESYQTSKPDPFKPD